MLGGRFKLVEIKSQAPPYLITIIFWENSRIQGRFKYKNIRDNKSEGFEKIETKNYSHPEIFKEDLVSNLSFELQAPLGSISGLAEYIRRDLGSDISESASENLEILKRTANKANLIL